jgi:hypothetical protein
VRPRRLVDCTFEDAAARLMEAEAEASEKDVEDMLKRVHR